MARMKHQTTVFYLIPRVALRPEMVVILAFQALNGRYLPLRIATLLSPNLNASYNG